MIEQRQAGVRDNTELGQDVSYRMMPPARLHGSRVSMGPAGPTASAQSIGPTRQVGARHRIGIALGLMLAAATFVTSLSPRAVQAQEKPAAPAKADPAKAEKIAGELCAACHGPDGNSTAPANPKLAAQHPEYLYKQLKEFKIPEGGKVALRNNAIMSGMVAALSDDDMRNLAAYYAGKALKPSAAKNKDTVDLGRSIYRGGIADKGVPACAGCHGARGEGIPAQYPLLHGQYAEYTEAQLTGFRAGTRANNATMMTIAGRLSDREIKAVSDYIAGLR